MFNRSNPLAKTLYHIYNCRLCNNNPYDTIHKSINSRT